MKDNYELFPQKMIEELKFDIETLKKRLLEPDKVADELMAEMADLKAEIKELHNIFQETLADIKEEDSSKQLATMKNKIETVATQNETIARGMVAISDKLEDFMRKSQGPVRKMAPGPQHTTIPPMGTAPAGSMTPPLGPLTQASGPRPPLPPGYTGPTSAPPLAPPRPAAPTPPSPPKAKRTGLFK